MDSAGRHFAFSGFKSIFFDIVSVVAPRVVKWTPRGATSPSVAKCDTGLGQAINRGSPDPGH